MVDKTIVACASVVDKIILVCAQRLSFSNDFGSFMQAGFDTYFECTDMVEAEWLAAIFERDLINRIKPLRIMRNNEILKEYRKVYDD